MPIKRGLQQLCKLAHFWIRWRTGIEKSEVDVATAVLLHSEYWWVFSRLLDISAPITFHYSGLLSAMS